jgi:hypothetical protein
MQAFCTDANLQKEQSYFGSMMFIALLAFSALFEQLF